MSFADRENKRKIKVLVLEPHDDIFNILENNAIRHFPQFEILRAKTNEEADAILQSSEHQVSAAMIDGGRPVADSVKAIRGEAKVSVVGSGLDFIKRIRSGELGNDNSQIPVIYMANDLPNLDIGRITQDAGDNTAVYEKKSIRKALDFLKGKLCGSEVSPPRH